MRNRKEFLGIVLGLLFALMFMYCQGPEGPAGPKGEKGETGDPGDAGVSIVWKGELDAAPSKPELYWAYFNSDSGSAYIYTGKEWELLSRSGADGIDGEDGTNGSDGINGSDGVDGVSISWRGTLAAHPTSPKLNWAYYNSADETSYIYDGSKWQVLAKDGEIGPQGLKGDAGSKGDSGSKGDKGDKGEEGDPNGPQGPKGDDGKDVYLVVFNSMGGEPSIDAVGVNHGGTVPTPVAFEKTGYTLSGWYTNINLSGTAYNLSAPVTGNITLYAKWTAVSGGGPIEMVSVTGGTFTMGCTAEQGSDCYSDESPPHSVTVSSFSIGKYEVTQGQWAAVMGSNPSSDCGSYGIGDNYPVYCVSWNDIQDFISALNVQTGQTYRLPTEAEWEFAARGGNSGGGYKYSGSSTLGGVAWYWDNIPSQTSGNSGYGTQPVGTKTPNELGIYDMSGNVWEWVSDWYGSYSADAQTNPTGPASGSDRVNRGGGWSGDAQYCRVSFRSINHPDRRINNLGFRLAVSP